MSDPNSNPYIFPFGQPVRPVIQEDRSAKQAFILGVYASAVHARWKGVDGKTKIMALAVASEPYIFWRGDGAEEIVGGIEIPAEAGSLVPAAKNLNGPSGNTLDQAFIEPMGLTRDDCWLSDIYPHSCMNSKQRAALDREYMPIMEDPGLPLPHMPEAPKSDPGPERHAQILAELKESQADTIVLLGDLPIKWWLTHYLPHYKRLSNFGTTPETYGRKHVCEIDGSTYQLLPLVHPRQAGRLGPHSGRWAELHEGLTWPCNFSPEEG